MFVMQELVRGIGIRNPMKASNFTLPQNGSYGFPRAACDHNSIFSGDQWGLEVIFQSKGSMLPTLAFFLYYQGGFPALFFFFFFFSRRCNKGASFFIVCVIDRTCADWHLLITDHLFNSNGTDVVNEI